MQPGTVRPFRISVVGFVLSTVLPSLSSGQSAFALDSNALGPIRACDSLATIHRVFAQARDTSIHGEGDSQWPARIIRFGDGTWLLFETSWADTTHVWRFSTNSPRFRTRRGYHVGTRLGELVARGERVTAELAEGQVGFELVSEKIGFEADARSEARVPYDWPPGKDATALLDPNGRIVTLGGGGRCRY